MPASPSTPAIALGEQLPGDLIARTDEIEVPKELSDPPKLRFIQIRDTAEAGRLVTFLCFVPPAIKTRLPGRVAYRQLTAEQAEASANIVEVDLFPGGGHVLRVPYLSLPLETWRVPIVVVERSGEGSGHELYPSRFQYCLPTVSIPLRPRDNDVVLDLQALIDLCYDRGRYARIDYRREPEPPLSSGDAAWADALLREKGLR